MVAVEPLTLSLFSVRAMAARRLHVAWLTVATSLCLFLAVAELNFYREFHQRLNSLVFQYMQEDLGTVSSMIWNGFPVLRLLLVWALATAVLAWLFRRIERATRARSHAPAPRWPAAPNAIQAISDWRMASSTVMAMGVTQSRGTNTV